MTEKTVILDDSIPEIVRAKSGWMIKHWASQDEKLRFELALSPPVPKGADFSMPLTRDDQPRLTVQFFKDCNGPEIVVSMDQGDARLAREFIEKHYPDAHAA